MIRKRTRVTSMSTFTVVELSNVQLPKPNSSPNVPVHEKPSSPLPQSQVQVQDKDLGKYYPIIFK